uniref:Chromosome 1 open reading frame 174 n=1 Tax=Amazona collaria TaxID=241587 RepID=A0A8B9FQD4_9PSIT
MAAGGPEQGWSRTEAPGSALPGRRRERLLGYCAEGSLEGGSPAAASAQPAGEASPAARRQQRGGPQTPGQRFSQKAAERRPSKRLKSELGLARGSATLAALVETPPTTGGDQCSEDLGDHNIIQQQTGESIPETNKEKQEKEHNVSRKPRAVESSDAPSKTDSGEDVHACVCSEESSCESALSNVSGPEDTDLPKKRMRLDSSAFLDEDSNQPMPMDRFFGDVEFLQDLPAVALPSTTMSRREFRKLHFIAKEEEEDEDVV